MLSSIRLALDTLRLNPLRTALSTLGIIMGAASLAAVLALADGGERLAREAIERQGLASVNIRSQTERIVDGLRLPQPAFPHFSEADAEQLASAAGPKASLMLFVEGTGTLDAPGQRTRAVRVTGRYDVNRVASATERAELLSGRILTADDLGGSARVAMLTSRFAEELTSAGIPGGKVGDAITITGATFQVVGILASPKGESVFSITVPLAHAEAAMTPSPTPRARTIVLTAQDVADVVTLRTSAETFAKAKTEWNGRVNIVAYGPERLEQAARGILIFKMLMGAFTAISLVVGGIGIMNVLLASILERTREIGIRKAVGARRRDVLRQFMVESITISVAGTAAGVALGLAVAFGATAFIRAKTAAPMYAAVTWQTLAVTATAAIAIGLAAGVYPAMRASRLTTIDAIQRE